MVDLHAKFRTECDQSTKHFRTELTHLRSGRASASLLETIHVDYYGTLVPLQSLGLIGAPEPRLLTVQIYDRGAVEAVEKAILASDLGLNPSRDGSMLRIPIPALTEDRRRELIKKIHKMAEESKVSVRNHRRDQIEHLKKMEKSKELSEDSLKKAQEEVQKVTDKFIAEIDQILAAKEKELLDV